MSNVAQQAIGSGPQTQNVLKEFLTFALGGEEYGIAIQGVQELRGYDSVTRIATAEDYIKGVINLRGVIVPIVDMRIKMQLSDPTYDQFTVVIVVNLANRVVGLVVDSVSDVIGLADDQIKAAPALGVAAESNYVIGLGTIDQRMLILIDTTALLAGAELNSTEKLAA
ncbi:MAG: chemotaxis protein CheW [Burkholderiaceae bacterium]|nr:chemotaxis protein CheW [Burkholderiaceae bacterium]